MPTLVSYATQGAVTPICSTVTVLAVFVVKTHSVVKQVFSTADQQSVLKGQTFAPGKRHMDGLILTTGMITVRSSITPSKLLLFWQL